MGLDVWLQHRTLTNGVKKKLRWDVILSDYASEVLVTEGGGKVESRNGGRRNRKAGKQDQINEIYQTTYGGTEDTEGAGK